MHASEKRSALIKAIEHKVLLAQPDRARPELMSKALEVFLSFASLDLIEQHCAGSMAHLYGQFYQLIERRKKGEPAVASMDLSRAQGGWKHHAVALMVATDDMPFLVSSLRMAIDRQGFHLQAFVNAGGVHVQRDEQGHLQALLDEGGETEEAWSLFLLAPEHDPHKKQCLIDAVHRTLSDVAVAVEDWRPMQGKMFDVVDAVKSYGPVIGEDEAQEVSAFCAWLSEYFTFLGYRDYTVSGSGKTKALILNKGSGLGVLRDDSMSRKARYYAELPEHTREHMLSKRVMIISKSNTYSTVHRPTYTDYIAIKVFDEQGEIVGERRFIGLFTADLYDSDPTRIPVLRRKVKYILDHSMLPENGYGLKTLTHILKGLPRDELLQVDAADLLPLAMSILEMQDRHLVKTYLRRDVYNRFVSVLVFVPRENYTTALRLKMEAYLLEVLQGVEIGSTPRFSESALAQVYFSVRLPANQQISFDAEAIEAAINKMAQSWSDKLLQALDDRFGSELAHMYFRAYHEAFPPSYCEFFEGADVATDINYLEDLIQGDSEVQVGSLQIHDESRHVLNLKMYQKGETKPLSGALPILENMGLLVLKETTFSITHPRHGELWISDYYAQFQGDWQSVISHDESRYKEALTVVWHQQVEDDRFNHLIIAADVTVWQVNLLRAYAKYLKQIRFSLSEAYIHQTLNRYPATSRLLIQYFEYLFNPRVSGDRQAQVVACRRALMDLINQVQALDEERIFKRYLDVISATVRTNAYQGRREAPIVFKLCSSRIPEMPLPAPKYEMFVYSHRFEGVHLRTSEVARGGLRWSDRPEDFRTEVLGLMKAQEVKNSIIVPSGAKGGFVPKYLPSPQDREAFWAEGTACYKAFIGAMLDITDNIIDGKTLKPEDVVCYDQDDPYLVVAADKGTATFSDTANTIALSRQFWLGDGFASGGSAGYDHKKMGITAKGAWESVKWHFQEMNHDVDTQPFTVVGIGDMSGDVFGNGMLLSKQIKLIAAFNHRHIFLDPDPDPAQSYAERERLFALPRSGWDDYDKACLSEGGGVYERSAKAIELSPQMCAVLGISDDAGTMDPASLIQMLLRADVDLLWNGGIGTYVKATSEAHQDVGDKHNDALRVNGSELRCSVIGEGGNLGLTQLARVEYALHGGRINTDFIDNSAGVDCSDHEVNIKILLNPMVASGSLSLKDRNALLHDMTDEVAELVLASNRMQNHSISRAYALMNPYWSSFERFIEQLERIGVLNRDLEFLPESEELLARRGRNQLLTRPELSVLLSYSKMVLKREIMKADLFDDPGMDVYLRAAFPRVLSERYEDAIDKHPLRRQIIATKLSSQFVSEVGVTFVQELKDSLHVSIEQIIRAYQAARYMLDMPKLQAAVQELEPKLSAKLLIDLRIDIRALMRRSMSWLLQNMLKKAELNKSLETYKASITELIPLLPRILTGHGLERYLERRQSLEAIAEDHDAAAFLAATLSLYHGFNIIHAAQSSRFDLKAFADVYYIVAERLNLNWLRERVRQGQLESKWDSVARMILRADIDRLQRIVTRAIFGSIKDIDDVAPEALVEAWMVRHKTLVEDWRQALGEVAHHTIPDFATAFVVIRSLFQLFESNKH